VAGLAEGDEIALYVGPRLITKLLMVDLKVLHRTAPLAAPRVAAKNSLS
jgi:hypothetical protein